MLQVVLPFLGEGGTLFIPFNTYNQFVNIIFKHLTLRNLILGFIMVILSYLIRHYLFPLFDFKPEFTFNIGDTIYKFLIPTEILAGLTSLLASLSIRGLLEEVLYN